MKFLIGLTAAMAFAGIANAAVANHGATECKIMQWDQKYFELACDPRAPKVTLRTPAEWVKKALGSEKPAPGKTVEVTVSGEQLRSWIDMNKKALAKADAAAVKAGPKKGAK